MTGKLFLGIDISTQSCKGVIIDNTLQVLYSASITYDTDCPSHRTVNGVYIRDNGIVVSPTLMWVEALDLLFTKMRGLKFPLSHIKAVSVSGQQHGSVYWNNRAHFVLSQLDPSLSLTSQLSSCFSLQESPIWMDTSTTSQCRRLEKAVGGAASLVYLTGSRAYERFTGNQIMKIAEEQSDAYTNTSRISLVSSFIPSLLAGRVSEIDLSDASGMNLLNLQTRDWSRECLEACAPSLQRRLGCVVPSKTIIGRISGYFVKKYEMNDECEVVCGSGDNPCSLVGLRVCREGDVAVSLGTSNTVFRLSEKYLAMAEGHVFVSPMREDRYMTMLCFMNGDIARSTMCERHANGDWTQFNQLLLQSPAGNRGTLVIMHIQPEITPQSTTTGIYRYNEEGEVNEGDSASECRGVIESQFLSMRLHLRGRGCEKSERIIATGGCSVNQTILQILSDVFQLPVYTIQCKDSACVGAAIRACHAYECVRTNCEIDFESLLERESPYQLVCVPNESIKETYETMLRLLERCEEMIY